MSASNSGWNSPEVLSPKGLGQSPIRQADGSAWSPTHIVSACKASQGDQGGVKGAAGGLGAHRRGDTIAAAASKRSLGFERELGQTRRVSFNPGTLAGSTSYSALELKVRPEEADEVKQLLEQLDRSRLYLAQTWQGVQDTRASRERTRAKLAQIQQENKENSEDKENSEGNRTEAKVEVGATRGVDRQTEAIRLEIREVDEALSSAKLSMEGLYQASVRQKKKFGDAMARLHPQLQQGGLGTQSEENDLSKSTWSSKQFGLRLECLLLAEGVHDLKTQQDHMARELKQEQARQQQQGIQASVFKAENEALTDRISGLQRCISKVQMRQEMERQCLDCVNSVEQSNARLREVAQLNGSMLMQLEEQAAKLRSKIRADNPLLMATLR